MYKPNKKMLMCLSVIILIVYPLYINFGYNLIRTGSISGKKIFITGGAGFIATALIARLAEQNLIIAFDNFSRDSLSRTKYFTHQNVRVIKGDVLDLSHTKESMRDCDIVVHAAAIAGIDTVITYPTRTMQVNLIGTANVLEAARLNQIADRVVNFSTSEVFGSMAFKPSEDRETVSGSAGEARWTYSVSKLAAEHLSIAYFKEFKLPTVSIRPFNIYGPGQTGEGAIHTFIKGALEGRPLKIHGDGNQIRAWCFIDDFIDGLLSCITNSRAVGEVFNIGNPRTVVTTYELAQIICRVLGSSSEIEFVPALSADVELRIPSVEKAKSILGFKATIDLEDGIKRTAGWIRSSHGNALS